MNYVVDNETFRFAKSGQIKEQSDLQLMDVKRKRPLETKHDYQRVLKSSDSKDEKGSREQNCKGWTNPSWTYIIWAYKEL